MVYSLVIRISFFFCPFCGVVFHFHLPGFTRRGCFYLTGAESYSSTQKQFHNQNSRVTNREKLLSCCVSLCLELKQGHGCTFSHNTSGLGLIYIPVDGKPAVDFAHDLSDVKTN
ncbi:unnamed protein product [Clavelina lepadiformis]|uniref:Secreted protein n=1 Tax=Clavelina lepadiformis TaxID=159417 RepID=A0ABP0EXA0_CLALP